MINVAKPLITSRFNVTDVKNCFVLNNGSSYETLNSGVPSKLKSAGCKKARTLLKSKKLKKY